MNDTALQMMTNGTVTSMIEGAQTPYQQATGGWWIIVLMIAVLAALYLYTESFELLSVGSLLMTAFTLAYGPDFGIQLTMAGQAILYAILTITFGMTIFLFFGGGGKK